MLHIHQIQIKIWKDFFDHLKRCACHALQGGVNPPLLGSSEKVSRKLRLTEALTSGECQAAAGTTVVRTILLNHLDHLFYGDIPADHFVLTEDFHSLDLVFL